MGLSVVGEYQVLGRCQDIDGAEVYAARKGANSKAPIFCLHHFPKVSPAAEKQLRAMTEKTRGLDDPILVAPRDIVRTDDGLFVVTDFVAGETLEAIIKSHPGAIPKLLAVVISRDLARSVEKLRQRSAGLLLGEISSAHVLVTYDKGQVKLIAAGAALARGRSTTTSASSIGAVLSELLAARQARGRPVSSPNLTGDLDRIVSGAITAYNSDVSGFGTQLEAYLQSRMIPVNKAVPDLSKLIHQHFSHKAKAMHSLVERWRQRSAIRRSSSISAHPLAEPNIAILEPVEIVRTEDITKNPIPKKRPTGWPRMRLAFLLLLLSLTCATAALKLLNDEGCSKAIRQALRARQIGTP